MSYLFISDDKLGDHAVIRYHQGMQLVFLHNKIIDVMIIMDTNFIAKNTEMVIIVAFASL